MTARFVSTDVIRAMFCVAMSHMYRSEVPQYRALCDLVEDVDRSSRSAHPELEERLKRGDDLDRLGVERHGAIRVGTARELSGVRRLFAVMGMSPVGYYDLSPAGVPVHSTAFRPISGDALRRSPFRIFTSLLRLELIVDADLRREAEAILARRRIFTPRCLQLIAIFEQNGGLDETQAREFVAEAIETFRWHGEAGVSAGVYAAFHAAHPLVADIVCFKGPHINHLTLPTFDIDAVQQTMREKGLNPKAIVEGPPRRACPILLRQTSFKAIAEPVFFAGHNGAKTSGAHTARFGEIEQRGAALTTKGRVLYDRLLANVNAAVPLASDGSNAQAYMSELVRQFEAFPDDYAALRAERLAFFRYVPTDEGLGQRGREPPPNGLEGLALAGHIRAEPILYEDFLPVSAAGIFQSNLGETSRQNFAASANQAAFEAALGAHVLDSTTLYAEAEEKSRIACLHALGWRDQPAR